MSLRPGAVNFGEKWRGLEITISAVVTLSPVSHGTWNDQYSDIYALCEAFPTSYADKLYKETQALLQGFVTGLLESVGEQESASLLNSYQQHWLRYQQGAKYLDNLFSYYNRVPLRKYQPHHDVMPCHVIGIATPLGATPKSEDSPIQIRHMALKVWKVGLLEPLRQKLVAALLEEIRRDRDGESADLGMVRDVVGSFIEVEESKADESLRYYQESFESPFLAETGHYYRLAASGMVTDLSCSEYIRQVVSQLQTARRAGMRFLHPTSLTKFLRECESRLVVDYKDAYIYTHTRDMVRLENSADLSNLFILFSNIPKALQPIVQEFEEHVREKGTLSLRQLYQDRGYGVGEFVSAVLTVHSHYQTMVTNLFSGHKDFTAALDRACRAFVNIPEKPRQQPKAPLLLARYCDQLLRKTSKGSAAGSEGEVEDRLQDAITVFRYVEDKDMFQRFYSRMLSRRLVQALSLSMEAEETMIYKLKHACGYEYTARLQRMVVDIRLSADTMTAFQESLAGQGDTLPISFSTMVLQSAAWPLQKSTCTVAIPPSLQLAKTKFERFYMSKHNGRTLSWLHHLSLSELRLSYLKKAYTVSVSTYQMAVLLAYNQTNSLSLTSLAQLTQLPAQELSSTLQSLTESKLLLQQGGASEEDKVQSSSHFTLNMNYSNKRTKFKITAMLQKDSQQEIEQTLYNVTEDRKLHIQAAIVRVMKARKLLQHNQLIQEAISQVRSRFTPNVQMIKRCIETLMEKQYLERQEGSRDTYAYMA